MLILERYDRRTEKSRLKLLHVFTIGEERFAEWKRAIGDAWETRVRKEMERDYGDSKSDEEWQKYYVFMRTKD